MALFQKLAFESSICKWAYLFLNTNWRLLKSLIPLRHEKFGSHMYDVANPKHCAEGFGDVRKVPSKSRLSYRELLYQ